MVKNEILIIHGDDYKAMAKRVLEQADLAGLIGSRERHIGLKPNMVVPKPASAEATTHPELLDGTLEYLTDHGFTNITVMESSWVGADTQDALRVCGYREVIERYQIPFIDIKKERSREYDAAGINLKVCDAAMKVDFMINMPVLKGHCQTTVTCALKNMKGVIPDSEKRRFHTMGLHKPIAHLNTVVRNDFILVDNICGDLDFEEGGNPVEMDRILGFRDPVLCDSFVCEAMGYHSEEVPYIVLAEQLGVGSRDTQGAVVTKLNEGTLERRTLPMTGRVKKLAAYTEPADACSACYGSLISALDRLQVRGQLSGKHTPVAIGQGYKGKGGKIGVGNCTRCFEKSLKGCPPRAVDITAFLEKEWD